MSTEPGSACFAGSGFSASGMYLHTACMEADRHTLAPTASALGVCVHGHAHAETACGRVCVRAPFRAVVHDGVNVRVLVVV